MTPLLFAIAGTSIVWEVWPGSSAVPSTGLNRLNALGIVLMLAGLALMSRRFLGPVGDSRIARFLRVGAYVGYLVLIPAKAAIEQFSYQLPRGNVALLLYRAIDGATAESGTSG